jgi:hypothetical protein
MKYYNYMFFLINKKKDIRELFCYAKKKSKYMPTFSKINKIFTYLL